MKDEYISCAKLRHKTPHCEKEKVHLQCPAKSPPPPKKTVFPRQYFCRDNQNFIQIHKMYIFFSHRQLQSSPLNSDLLNLIPSNGEVFIFFLRIVQAFSAGDIESIFWSCGMAQVSMYSKWIRIKRAPLYITRVNGPKNNHPSVSKMFHKG